VAAVAERLVFRRAAAAQRVTPGRDAAAERVTFEVDRADSVRAVLDDSDLGRFRGGPMFGIVDRAGERAGRAAFHRLDDGLAGRAVGIDPGFLAHAEYAGEVIRAKSRVDAHPAVVVDRDTAARVTHAIVGRAVRETLVAEAVVAVGTVTKGLVARTAAAAQGDACDFADRFAVGAGDV